MELCRYSFRYEVKVGKKFSGVIEDSVKNFRKFFKERPKSVYQILVELPGDVVWLWDKWNDWRKLNRWNSFSKSKEVIEPEIVQESKFDKALTYLFN